MKNLFWRIVARIISKPRIADYLIARAMKTPYMHLPSNEDPSYMARYWLFNPYDRETNKPRWRLIPWSIRIHHIKREDQDRALHDHPWNARTIILKGYYFEQRLPFDQKRTVVNSVRVPGSTAAIHFEQYHRITEVSDGGVWTLFISGPWQGVWGFLVDGVKVPWKKYLGIPEKGDLSDAGLRPDQQQTRIYASGGMVDSSKLHNGEVPTIISTERVMPNEMFMGRTTGKIGDLADKNKLILPNINAKFGKMGSRTLKIVDQADDDEKEYPTSWQPIAELNTAERYAHQLMLFCPDLVDPDYNPSGTFLGHWCDDLGFQAPVWCGYHDEFHTKVVVPSHFAIPMVSPVIAVELPQ